MKALTSLMILGLIPIGCATYHPLLLNRSTVAQRLKPPSREAIKVAARAITHPLLNPLDYDDRDGLSLDEVVILAVLANPTLRALRDRRGVAAA